LLTNGVGGEIEADGADSVPLGPSRPRRRVAGLGGIALGCGGGEGIESRAWGPANGVDEGGAEREKGESKKSDREDWVYARDWGLNFCLILGPRSSPSPRNPQVAFKRLINQKPCVHLARVYLATH
jgi:hypothetical protein